MAETTAAPVWSAEHPGHLASCSGEHARAWDGCPGQDDAIVSTEAEALAYLTRDGSGELRVPVSRYGSTGAECAPAAYRAAAIVASECGEPVHVRDLDYAMSLAVNDHDDIGYLLSEYGEPGMRDRSEEPDYSEREAAE